LREFIPLSDGYGLSLYALEQVVGHTIPTAWLFDLVRRVWDVSSVPLVVFAAIVSVWGLRRLIDDRRQTTDEGRKAREERVATWLLIVGASVFYVAVFRLPYLHPYQYGFLKSLTLVALVLLAVFVEGLTRVKGRVWRWVVGVGAAGFVTVNGLTFGIMLEQYFKPMPAFFDADALGLRAARGQIPPGAQIFLTDRAEAQGVQMGFAAYVLRGFELHGKVKTGYAALDNAPRGAVYDFALLATGEDARARGYDSRAVWSSARWAVYPKRAGLIAHWEENTLAPAMINVEGEKATREVELSLASFVTQTVTVGFGADARVLTIRPGVSVYRAGAVGVPVSMTITNTAPLYVNWAEVWETRGNVPSLARTDAVVLEASSTQNDALFETRARVANPANVGFRWVLVLRGTRAGSFQDEEFGRWTIEGAPGGEVLIRVDAREGTVALGLDGRANQVGAGWPRFDGNYRADLEIMHGDRLSARVALYRYRVGKGEVERWNDERSGWAILGNWGVDVRAE
jgi:hypothetical protein